MFEHAVFRRRVLPASSSLFPVPVTRVYATTFTVHYRLQMFYEHLTLIARSQCQLNWFVIYTRAPDNVAISALSISLAVHLAVCDRETKMPDALGLKDSQQLLPNIIAC